MDDRGAAPSGTSNPAPPASPPEPVRRSRLRTAFAISIAIALVALAVAWSTTPLGRALDLATIADHARRVRDWPLAPLAVIAVFVVFGLVATPVTLMIGVTALLFGPWLGSLYAFAGMTASSIVVYSIGRFAARDMVDEWLARRVGSKLEVFNRRLARRGLVAVALLRLVPVPFSLQNLMAGASRVGFVDFVLGTSVGILPTIAVMAGLASEFDAWLAHPDWGRLLSLIAAVVAVVAVGWSLRLWAARRDADR